jgi:hypothetical protein
LHAFDGKGAATVSGRATAQETKIENRITKQQQKQEEENVNIRKQKEIEVGENDS